MALPENSGIPRNFGIYHHFSTTFHHSWVGFLIIFHPGRTRTAPRKMMAFAGISDCFTCSCGHTRSARKGTRKDCNKDNDT